MHNYIVTPSLECANYVCHMLDAVKVACHNVVHITATITTTTTAVNKCNNSNN